MMSELKVKKKKRLMEMVSCNVVNVRKSKKWLMRTRGDVNELTYKRRKNISHSRIAKDRTVRKAKTWLTIAGLEKR